MLFGRAGWRTVGDVPANTQGLAAGGVLPVRPHLRLAEHRLRGPAVRLPARCPTSTRSMRSSASSSREEQRRPVMAEIDLITSHAPWSRTPRLIDQSAVGDGSVYDGMPEQLPSAGRHLARPHSGSGRRTGSPSSTPSTRSHVPDDVRRRRPGRGHARRPPARDHRVGRGRGSRRADLRSSRATPTSSTRSPAGDGTRGSARSPTHPSGGWTPSATVSSRRTARARRLDLERPAVVEPVLLSARIPERRVEMPDHEVALMQQLHDEHAVALWRFCLRLVGNDQGTRRGRRPGDDAPRLAAPRRSSRARRRRCVPGCTPSPATS